MVKPFQLTADSDAYPVGLLDLEDRPTLWQLGELLERPGVAIVGTRRCTRYGVDLAEAFGLALARAGWTTVSGLARGIDTAAHRGCLRLSGHAVAVLGSGIDVCYPRENKPMYDQIVDSGGAILSEYPLGTPPDRWRFPARNRILAAISSAVVVVEAAATGGALITARLAAELGRPVFAVPGDVDRPMSEGCNRLIRDGAHPVLGSSDLIEELSLILGPPAPALDTYHGIPSEGVEIKDLPALWSLTVTETLIKLGRLE
ncbi:MAG TPA: DNA-processing protein DprA, partial [Acidimicrobiia bacterium]